MSKPLTPARVVHDEVCGELPLGLARRWDREWSRRCKRSPRDRRCVRKYWKLVARSTYQRRDHWRLEACRKRVQADAEALAQCLETQTGRPCSADYLLNYTHQETKP